MFCEKCGKKNEADARFCESCGFVLGTEEITFNNEIKSFISPDLGKSNNGYYNTRNVGTVKIKPMSVKKKILLCLIIILLILVCGVYLVGSYFFSPKKIVHDYIENMISKNYKAMYNCLDVDSNEFATEELFVKLMKEQDVKKNNILNYTVEEKITNNPFTKEFLVSFIEKGKSEASSIDVILVKQSVKKWYIFDEYKVFENEFVITDYSVTIPINTEIYINGIKLDKRYAVESNNVTEQKFIIPSVFEGTYEVKVTSPFCEDEIFEQDINNTTNLAVRSLKLSEKTHEEIKKDAQEFIEEFFYTVIKNKPFEEIEQYCSKSNEENFKEIKKVFDNIGSKVDLTKISHAELFPSNIYVERNYGKDDVLIFVRADFISYFDYIKLYFTYENKKWLINSIYID